MRFLTSDYLFPLDKMPIKNGVLQISDNGEVIAIFKERSQVPQQRLEVFDGILCPGFVNAHCHLELSHFSETIKKGRGFLDFIAAIKKRDSFKKDQIQIAIENAEKEMIANGIVGVGDICNTPDTLLQKSKGNLEYYNFIEIFQSKPDKLNDTIQSGIYLRDQFRKANLKTTIVPHAPYSVPPKLMRLIGELMDEQDERLTIHMQETLIENQLFENKSGDFYNWLKSIGASEEIWEKRNSSTDIFFELADKPLLLVHNTFSKKDDLSDNYYCTCPKANLYIENILPDYSIFDPEKLCVGTDSLASNDSLSILEELKVIKENSSFDLNMLLKIGSKNGAEALGFKNLGTFEKGKIPGVNLIQELEQIQVII